MADVSRLSMDAEQDASSGGYTMGSESRKSKLVKVHDFDIEFVYGWSRYNLRLIGLWPDQTCKNSQASFLIRYSPPMWSMMLFSFVVVPQTLAPIEYHFALGEVVEIISAIVGFIAAIVRIMVLWYNGEAWCLEFLSEDWSRNLTTWERETMMQHAKLGRKISIGVTIFVQCLLWSYVMLRALEYVKFEVEHNTELGKDLFYPSYFPFDLSNLSNFAFAWSGQYLSNLCSALAYSGTDGFVAMLVIHLCGQMTILRHAMLNLVDDKPVSPDIFRLKLRVIMERHHTLIRLATVIKDTISFMLLVLIVVYPLQLCCHLFHLIVTVTEREPGEFPYLEIFFYTSFLAATFLHLLVYCYIGDKLIQESEALGMASYSCKWYNLSSNKAKDLMFVMHRANAPLQIWAGKFLPFSLELFCKVLGTSMRFFSVLLTMKEAEWEHARLHHHL